MIRLFWSFFPFLLLSTTAVPEIHAQGAQPTATNNIEVISNPSTPSNLVSRAYQGAFIPEGIPGYGQLQSQYQLHQITGQDLGRAAIHQHRLPTSALSGRTYISAVDT